MKIKVQLSSVVLVLVVVLFTQPARAIADSGFSFQPPLDWIDLSDESRIKAAESKLPEDVRRRIGNPKNLAAFAIGPDFISNFNVTLQPGKILFTQDIVQELCREVPATVQKAHVFQSYEYESCALTVISDVPAGRFIASAKAGDKVLRQLIYTIPGRDTVATLTYSAPKDNFENLLDKFERSAKATTGVFRQPPLSNRVLRGMLAGAMWSGLVGLLGMALMRKTNQKLPAGATWGGLLGVWFMKKWSSRKGAGTVP